MGAVCECGGPAVVGTSSCAAVRRVLCARPRFAAPGGRCGLAHVLVPWLWPVACLSGVPRGPALVPRAFSVPVALGAPVGSPFAVVPSPFPVVVAPGLAARGTWGPAEDRALCACRWPLPWQGRWARSASYPFGAPRWGFPWQVPPASVLGCVHCGGLACVGPVTDASHFPYRPSFDGVLGWCTGAVSCKGRHLPFWVGGRHARVLRVCACACFFGRVGRPALSGVFWCDSSFPVAVLGALLVCSAPFGLGSPCLWFFLLSFPSAPPLSPAFRVYRPWVPSALASCAPPPLSWLVVVVVVILRVL